MVRRPTTVKNTKETALYEALCRGSAEAQAHLPQGYHVEYEDAHAITVAKDGFTDAAHYAGDGWKLHVSVDSHDVPRTTPLVMEAIDQFGVAAFKVGAAGRVQRFDNPLHPQAGKQFSIYGLPKGKERDFACYLELKLLQHKIMPGTRAIKGDRAIRNSAYLAYRNELLHGNTALEPYANVDGYLSADAVQRAVRMGVVPPLNDHNPTNQPDPLRELDMEKVSALLVARAAHTQLRSRELSTRIQEQPGQKDLHGGEGSPHIRRVQAILRGQSEPPRR